MEATGMRHIRIGKDIRLSWSILTDGAAVPLEGRDLTLEMKSPIGKVISIPYSIEGNVLTITYYGYEQTVIGEYSLTLWENKGKHGQNVVDAIRAFKLVRTSPEEADFIGGDLQVESVDLGTANLEILSGGGATTPGGSPDLSALEGKVDANTTRISAVENKNTEQDTRMDKFESRLDPDIAGRVWNEDNGTPKAESYYGSVKALRDLPKRLGLGRYIVKDDRTRRKLDPNDSRKYLDGTPAKLDGTDGQCMWCWNGFYANVWKEGSRLIKAVTFDGPVGNDISIWIPAGGISWLGAGVIDRGEAPYTDKTKWKLCSVINNSEQFRGGGGTALDASKYSKAPAAESPQITMLGMPATNISSNDFSYYARKRGEGWEANWFVARFVVEFLFEIIMGTENSQEAFNNLKDANGLYQGGFGTGVTDMPDWSNYNGYYPVIPTSVGLEAGDGVCLVPYNLPDAGGGTYKTFNVPVFFGLVGAGFGNLWQVARGVIVKKDLNEWRAYVTQSMYADYDDSTVKEKIPVAKLEEKQGYISRKSYRGLCCIPTEVKGTEMIRYSDSFLFSNNNADYTHQRACGGTSSDKQICGISTTSINSAPYNNSKVITSPLCYFTEDPIIPSSQSIANNS